MKKCPYCGRRVGQMPPLISWLDSGVVWTTVLFLGKVTDAFHPAWWLVFLPIWLPASWKSLQWLLKRKILREEKEDDSEH